MNDSPLTKAQLSHLCRRHVEHLLFDESGVEAAGTAIYSLADPRDIRLVRYIGQSTNPRRRFLQHLCAARLWLPDDRPWWIKSPELRPLYQWIRALYADGGRLPTMVISEWIAAETNPLLAERARIQECLNRQLPLLNFEHDVLIRKGSRSMRPRRTVRS